MKIKSLWGLDTRSLQPTDFFKFELLTFGAVDCQHYIVFCNILFALDYNPIN